MWKLSLTSRFGANANKPEKLMNNKICEPSGLYDFVLPSLLNLQIWEQ